MRMRDVSIGYAEAKNAHSLWKGEHKKMKTILKKCLSLVLTAGLLASLAGLRRANGHSGGKRPV